MIKRLTSEGVGLTMICVTLIAILVIVGSSTFKSYNERVEIIKQEGSSLARLLSKIPLEQFLQTSDSIGVLQLLTHNKHSSDFSYAAVVNLLGEPISSVVAKQALIPDVPLTAKPNLWVTEHTIEQPPLTYIEFRAPILDQKELSGYIRLGYLKPKVQIQFADISSYAQVALPIFLLVPIFYVLFRRETQALKEASAEIKSFMNTQHLKLESDDDKQDIINNLRQFMTTVGHRMDDITNQQTRAQELTLLLGYKNKRIESALQSMSDAVVVIDEHGLVSYANTRLDKLIGVSAEDVCDKIWHDWIDDPQVRNLLYKYHSNKTSHRTETITYVPDGRPENFIAVTASPLFSPTEGNTVLGTLIVFHDKTNEVLAAQVSDDFLNHVAHEMKSPLNVIKMYAETLLDDMGDDKKTRVESLNVVMDEIERMTLLISNLLNISKIESGSINLDKQRVKLNEFVQDVFDTLARAGKEKQINFELKMPRTLGAVNIDKELMRIALSNLLSNAIKYNDANGHVTLQVNEDDEQYEIIVTDDGVGISEHDLQYVFEKFYRSDSDEIRERNGHGLGLSLTKNIVDFHQGNVSAVSILGQGTTFTITLSKQAVFHDEVNNK